LRQCRLEMPHHFGDRQRLVMTWDQYGNRRRRDIVRTGVPEGR
jgi:hypothetical protein